MRFTVDKIDNNMALIVSEKGGFLEVPLDDFDTLIIEGDEVNISFKVSEHLSNSLENEIKELQDELISEDNDIIL